MFNTTFQVSSLCIHYNHCIQWCRGRADKTSDFHTGGPRFESPHDSSTQHLSSLPSLSEETLSHRWPVLCKGESPTFDAHKRTHFTSLKRAGRNPGEVVSQSHIWKRMNDVDPSWFTLEGYIYNTQCVSYEWHQPGILICHMKEEDCILSLMIHCAYSSSHLLHSLHGQLKHRDSFGKKKKKKLVLYLIRHYPKYFWTTFTLWTKVRLTIW